MNIKEIITAVGGKDNIATLSHCISRLRFQLVDTARVDVAALDQIELVKGNFYANDQFQVVIGQGTVDKVYTAVVEQLGTGPRSLTDTVTLKRTEKLNPLQKLITLLSDVFIPLLPAIVASGLLLGLNNVLTGPGIFGDVALSEMYPQIDGIAGIVSLIAGTAFAFLPALVSWSVVKRFGGNPLMGMILGLVLVNPALLNGYVAHSETPELWHIFGLDVAKVGYQGQVLPALAAGFIYVKFEQLFKRIIPDALHLLLVSTLSLLVTSLLAFIVIGPITYQLSNWITDSIVTLANFSQALTGFLFGAMFSLLAMTGMHHAFLAVNIQLIATAGGTMFWPVQALSDLAQGTAAFAIGVLEKGEKKTSVAFSAGFSAYLGITEPAMFGVNLKTKYSFIAAMFGASCGGGFIGASAVSSSAIGVSGILSFLAINRESWTAYIIGMIITIGVTILLTVAFHMLFSRQANKLNDNKDKGEMLR